MMKCLILLFPDNHPKNTAAIKKKRLKYFTDRRTTSHWPCPIHVNGLQPQTYGDKSRLIDYSKIVKYDFTDLKDEIMKFLWYTIYINNLYLIIYILNSLQNKIDKVKIN